VPSKRIVSASPLILLGKIDRLDLLFVGVREVVVPATVLDEVGDPRLRNLPGWDQSLPPLGVDTDVPIPPDVGAMLWTLASRWCLLLRCHTGRRVRMSRSCWTRGKEGDRPGRWA